MKIQASRERRPTILTVKPELRQGSIVKPTFCLWAEKVVTLEKRLKARQMFFVSFSAKMSLKYDKTPYCTNFAELFDF